MLGSETLNIYNLDVVIKNQEELYTLFCMGSGMEPSTYLTIANLLFLAASIPNMAAAIKNRSYLRGFSFVGAGLNLLGC